MESECSNADRRSYRRGRFIRWFGHVEREDDADWVKGCMLMEIEGRRQRDARRRPGGIVSERMWRVLACPMKMRWIRIS